MRQILLQIITLAFFLLLASCASIKHKNITYLDSSASLVLDAQEKVPTLSVFEPRQSKAKKPVVIFVHGGNWNSGNKEIYSFIGRNFAKKKVVTVIPGYTLSPIASYDVMAKEIAQAVIWTQKNITTYGGDPEEIYVMGHSAGGHLVALVATNPTYIKNPSQIISGVILDDAAGLDMYSYLQDYPPTASNNYDRTWTKDPAKWKEASPIYYLDKETPPFKIYVGLKTYSSIAKYNEIFLKELHKYQPAVRPTYLDKKHVPMVTQFFWPWTDRYNEIINFIKSIN